MRQSPKTADWAFHGLPVIAKVPCWTPSVDIPITKHSVVVWWPAREEYVQFVIGDLCSRDWQRGFFTRCRNTALTKMIYDARWPQYNPNRVL